MCACKYSIFNKKNNNNYYLCISKKYSTFATSFPKQV